MGNGVGGGTEVMRFRGFRVSKVSEFQGFKGSRFQGLSGDGFFPGTDGRGDLAAGYRGVL